MDVINVIGHGIKLFCTCYLIRILVKNKSCGSISGKSQLLLAVIAMITSAEDISGLIAYHSLYYWRWVYIILHIVIISLMFITYRKTYRLTDDSFMTEVLVVPCILLSIWWTVRRRNEPAVYLHQMCGLLEPMALLPQFFLIYKQRKVEKDLLIYLICLGTFYTLFWIYPDFDRYDFRYTGNVYSHVYVIQYLCAMVAFYALEIRVTDSADNAHNILEEEKSQAVSDKSLVSEVNTDKPLEEIVSQTNDHEGETATANDEKDTVDDVNQQLLVQKF